MRPLLEKFGRRCRRIAGGVSHSALDFVFPRVCAWCGSTEVVAGEGKDGDSFDVALCSVCCLHIAPLVEQACLRCGAPVGPYLDSSKGCYHCHSDRFRFSRVFCLGVYDGPLRDACFRCKRPEGDVLAAALAGLLWERSETSLSAERVDIVVPVPRYWMNHLFGRFHPLETPATTLARGLKVKFRKHILLKVRRTPAQTELPPSKRRKNLRGAFRVFDARALQGKRVLLVDDILTTGATANEASKLLLRAGASAVVVAVLARGLGPSMRA